MKYWVVVFAAVVLAVCGGIWFGGGERKAGNSGGPKPHENTSIPPKPVHVPLTPIAGDSSVPVQSPEALELPLPTTQSAISSAIKPAEAAVPAGGGPLEAPPVEPGADDLEAAAGRIDQIGLMFRDYRTIMGVNPIGTNAEIIKAVNGGNPKQARLGPPAGERLNGRGELVDQWGTAYFFHQMSATEMEIHSAGPDRQLGTPDDIIGR